MEANVPLMTVRLPPEVKRVIKVTNLLPSMTGDKLYTLFGEFGAIRQIRVGSDPQTKGSAFVVFEDIYDAKRAMDVLDGQMLGKGKYLGLEYFDLERHTKMQERKRKRKEAEAEFKDHLSEQKRTERAA